MAGVVRVGSEAGGQDDAAMGGGLCPLRHVHSTTRVKEGGQRPLCFGVRVAVGRGETSGRGGAW